MQKSFQTHLRDCRTDSFRKFSRFATFVKSIDVVMKDFFDRKIICNIFFPFSLICSSRFSSMTRWQQHSSIHRKHLWWLMSHLVMKTKWTPTSTPIHPRSCLTQCHWVSDSSFPFSTSMIWCYMCFRFNAIRKLPAAESERDSVWVGHHQDHAIAFIRVKWREHFHIKPRIRWRRLFEASNRRRESTMEQWRHQRNWPLILNLQK